MNDICVGSNAECRSGQCQCKEGYGLGQEMETCGEEIVTLSLLSPTLFTSSIYLLVLIPFEETAQNTSSKSG